MARSKNIVKTVVDVPSIPRNAVIPAGTYGFVIERHQESEEYVVDLATPSAELVGGFQWDNVVLRPGQFMFVDEFPKSPYAEDE